MNEQARTPHSVLDGGAELDAVVAWAVMGWAALGAHLCQDAEGMVTTRGCPHAGVSAVQRWS